MLMVAKGRPVGHGASPLGARPHVGSVGVLAPPAWSRGETPRQRPPPSPAHSLPTPVPGPLPLGDRRSSKKHAGTRPLKERPHGKGPGPGAGTAFPSSCLLLPTAGRPVPLCSSREQGFGVVARGAVEEARPECEDGSTGVKARAAKWGAQVTLPAASSRSLQPSADTQQQRAGGGVPGRDGKGERKSWCCPCP